MAILLTLALGLLAAGAIGYRRRRPWTTGVVIAGGLTLFVALSPVKPPPAPVTAAPTPARAALTPVTPERTDAQNLAIITGRDSNDPDIAAALARLEALCPPERASVADMVVNLQQLVKRESGRDVAIVDVMRQLATAQEGGITAGMTCSETGGMLATLLIKGL